MSANGRLTAAELAPVWHPTAKVHLARAEGAAAGWNTMQLVLAHNGVGRAVGNGGDSFYRTYARQQYWKNYWCARGACGNAASPGSSNHGWGRAVDTNHRWKVWKYGRPYGWGPCTDAPWESWHTRTCGAYGRPNPGFNPYYPVLRRGSGGAGQGAWVRRLQVLLGRCGIPVRPLSTSFGPLTQAAVTEFQRRAGWRNPTGVCAEGTWRALTDHARDGGRRL